MIDDLLIFSSYFINVPLRIEPWSQDIVDVPKVNKWQYSLKETLDKGRKMEEKER